MADIDLERKRSSGMGWLWGLLALLLVVLAVWWLWPDANDVDVAELEPVEQVTPATTPDPTMDEGMAGLALSAVLSTPSEYIGATFPDTEVQVAEVPTDRGFWIEQDGDRLFAIIIDQPEEEPKDINPGATLQVTDGTLRAPSYLGQIEGRPLDDETRRIAEQQDILLVVDERYIEVTRAGTPQPGTDPAQGVGQDSL